MAFIADNIFDNGLSYATTNGAQLDITSSEATDFTDATSTSTLGNASITMGSPENGATDGRRVQIPAITSGSVTATGTAGFYALTDGTGELLATGPLSATQSVTSGNTFTLDAISLTLRDASAV